MHSKYGILYIRIELSPQKYELISFVVLTYLLIIQMPDTIICSQRFHHTLEEAIKIYSLIAFDGSISLLSTTSLSSPTI